MSENSKTVRSTRVLRDGTLGPADIRIRDGLIAAVAAYGSPVEGELHDLGDSLVMPGLVDVHVHVNEPGRAEWEGFDTATRAAAAGGVTGFVDMPLNSSPVTTSAQAFRAKLDSAQGAIHVDVGFWGGVIPQDLEELPELLAGGVLGVKAFLVHSGIEEFPNVAPADLEKAMPVIAASGLPLLVHCELAVAGAPPPEPDADPRSYRAYLASRPAAWELDAIDLVIALARKHQARVHIVHLSCADALPAIRRAKAEGLAVTVETCPHYLVLEAETIPDGDTRFKCAPPIREASNRERLWDGLRDGTIDFIATDHSPCPPELKRLDSGAFSEAWGGIASIQFLLPLVWTEADRRGFGPADLERWLCAAPARFAGLDRLERPKGRLAPGFQADLSVWDLEASFEVNPDIIRYRHRLSPYGGRRWRGVLLRGYLNGEVVQEGLDLVRERGGRALLRSSPNMDRLDRSAARLALAEVCPAPEWIDRMVAAHPWRDFRRMRESALEAWRSLDAPLQLEALRSHPRIGHNPAAHPEQAGVRSARAELIERLAGLNREYESRFGFPYVVFATGKTAEALSDMLDARLRRTRNEEWDEALRQQSRIIAFRLAKLERSLAR